MPRHPLPRRPRTSTWHCAPTPTPHPSPHTADPLPQPLPSRPEQITVKPSPHHQPAPAIRCRTTQPHTQPGHPPAPPAIPGAGVRCPICSYRCPVPRSGHDPQPHDGAPSRSALTRRHPRRQHGRGTTPGDSGLFEVSRDCVFGRSPFVIVSGCGEWSSRRRRRTQGRFAENGLTRAWSTADRVNSGPTSDGPCPFPFALH
jgi:hypothetical protein